MPNRLSIDLNTSALVLVDLQNGIVNMDVGPCSSAQVIMNAQLLAKAFRTHKATVVLVSIELSEDGGDTLTPLLEEPLSAIPTHYPSDWSALLTELNACPSDIRIRKRQWGAFYGTDLDLQLRRRNIRTIVLAGISTNIGVESTARDAFERGYNQVFISDAMASPSTQAHNNTFEYIFPRIGIIRSTAEVMLALGRP